ncbi:archaetidylserine decarboxylase [Aliiglaciecola sp. LCG003]|uniref:archaetidylserine decarboxylase n=1 Tax=Aliiglaciecola sp. LCG003 TaxID=3053655 RepID=UPI0025727AF7|nr:archaetidylserine decarboxylase [Aliiglaciecola sp. LCG003]WJG09612.1 archaetidylserine decarboxylase [Aliiglaciecola sp. LCG003]
MAQGKTIAALSAQERLNFLLTNRIPRRWLTLFMGWYSQIQSPLLTKISIKIWSLFAEDLRLEDAKKQHFISLQDCFTRQLKEGLRPINPHVDIITSPCDAIIGECGSVAAGNVFQAKGFPYDISDLIPNFHISHQYRDGIFVTLRLKSSMYHRFHAPVACRVNKLSYISGDTWNVNPVALKKIEKLFCKNERAVIELQMEKSCGSITLVPVAAILVASMKFNFLPHTFDLKYKGPNQVNCDASFSKGDEMGYFQHGSTIILFATSNHTLCDGIQSGAPIQMGQALLTRKPLVNGPFKP